MLSLMIAATVAAPQVATDPAQLAFDRCTTAGARKASGVAKGTQHRLGDEPPATQLYTVYQSVEGCPRPVVVRDGIGANPERRQPLVRSVPKARNLY